VITAFFTWWLTVVEAFLYGLRSYAPALQWGELLLLSATVLIGGILIGLRSGGK